MGCPHCGHSQTSRQEWLASRNAAIVRDYRAGKTQRELARKYGLTCPRISQVLGAAGARRKADWGME